MKNGALYDKRGARMFHRYTLAMNEQKRYRDLMEHARQAHQEFSRVWHRVKADELKSVDLPEEMYFWTKEQWHYVSEANGVAYEAARPLSDERNRFLGDLFEDMPLDEFWEGESSAIDAVIDFLEIDVMAFRCGYVKQKCFQRLKQLRLNPQQQQRLRRLMIAMCKFRGQRPEIRELTRLMILLADAPLIAELRVVAENHANSYAQQKAQRALQVILHHRPDLRES